MKEKDRLKSMVILISWAIIAITSWHSVQEIHYLKGFYTGSFTVAEARWATVVELIKVFLTAFPLLLLMWYFSRK